MADPEPAALVAVIGTFHSPAVLGLPLIAPVALLIVQPGGRFAAA